MRAAPAISAGRTLASLPLFAAIWMGLAAGLSWFVRSGLPPLMSRLGLGDIPEGTPPPLPEPVIWAWSLAIGVSVAAGVLTRYGFLTPTPGLGYPIRRGAGAEMSLGLVLGGISALAVVGAALLMGATFEVRVSGTVDVITVVSLGILTWWAVALFEERLFRGYFLLALAGHVGRGPALFVSAAVFALVQVRHPDLQSLPTLATAFVLGLGLGYAFMLTGSLWLSTLWHFSWDFMTGSVFGMPVSGRVWDSIFVVNLDAPRWLGGGTFGPQGSIPALIVTILTVSALAVLARRVPEENWSGDPAGLTTSRRLF